MAQESIGLIETRGFVGAVGAADAAVKAAHISLLPFELIGGGLVSVKFSGDVAAVDVALQAGVEAAQAISELVNQGVIPAPDGAISQAWQSSYQMSSTFPARSSFRCSERVPSTCRGS